MIPRAEAGLQGHGRVATTSAWLKFAGGVRHPLSMENGGQTKVLFCCAKCGAAYQAIQQWSPVRATGSFKCQVCRETLHSWAGRYDYSIGDPSTLRLKGEAYSRYANRFGRENRSCFSVGRPSGATSS